MLLLHLRLGSWFSRLWWILRIMHCVALCCFFIAALDSIVYIWSFLVLTSGLLLVLRFTQFLLDSDHSCKKLLRVPVFTLGVTRALLDYLNLVPWFSFLDISLWYGDKFFFVRRVAFWWQEVRSPHLTDDRSLLFNDFCLGIWRHKRSIIFIMS